jgi:hypothetical protein
MDRVTMARQKREHADAVPGLLKTAAASAQPSEVLLKAQVPGATTKREAQPQEWLVVTTWQVQTTFKAQNVADYDDGTPADKARMADAASQNQRAETRPAATMAVTRMFLGVYRASQVAQATTQATGKTTAPAASSTDLKSLSNSLSNQQAARPLGAVPFGDGWLVIQL